MKSKYKIGEVFDCYGNIIVITDVTIPSYKQGEHLYRFNHCISSNISNAWPYFINCYDSELDKFKKIEL